MTPQLRFPEFTGEWQVAKLNDLLGGVVDNRGKTPPVAEAGIPLIETNALGSKEVRYDVIKKFVTQATFDSWFRKYLNSDDVLFSTVGQTGVTALYDESTVAAVAQNIVGLRANEQTTGGFLYYLLSEKRNNNKFKQIEMIAVQPSVKVSQMIHLKFNTPSKPEQEKIADFMGGVDSKLTSIQAKVAAMHEYKKGVMQALFSGMLRFKDENGNPYPDWEEKKLGEIGEFIRGLTYSVSNVKSSGSLVLRSSNIQHDKLILDKDLQFVDKTINDNLNLQEDDIVICMSNGSKRLVGKNAVYEGNYEGTLTVGAFCSIFRPQSQLAKYLFQSEQYQRYLHILLAGTNINNLNNSDLTNLIFKLPSPEEQQKIADFLSALDDKIKLEEAKLASAKEFKKALLQRMFT